MVLSWLITLVLPLQSATNVSLKSSSCIAFPKKHHCAEKNQLHDPSCQESWVYLLQKQRLPSYSGLQPKKGWKPMRYSATSGARQNRQAQIFLLNHSDRHNPKITFFSFPFHRSSSVLDFDTAHTAERNISLHVASLTIVLHWVIQDFDTRQKKLNNAMQIQQWSPNDMTWLVACCERIYVCAHPHNVRMCVCCGMHLTVHACWSGPCGASDLSSPAGTAGCLPGDSALGLTAVSIQHHYLTCAYCQLTCGGHTHAYIHFRKRDIKNKDISSKILLYKLQHEGLISLKMSLSLSALLCSSLRVIAKAIMEGNKHGWLSVK